MHDIVSNGLQTGDRLLLESDMVELYGVSRTSLREALRLLEFQGLITIKPGPGGGPAVGTVDPARLAKTAALYFHLGAATYDDIMRTQVLMESTCARLAADNPDRQELMRPWFTDELPEELSVYRDLTTGFHGAVYDAVMNPVLSLLTQAVTHTVTHHVTNNVDPVHLRSAIMEEHAELARTIARGDGVSAEFLTCRHFEAQHDFVRATAPDLVEEHIQWR